MPSHLFKSSLPLSETSLRCRVSSWSASHIASHGGGGGPPQVWGPLPQKQCLVLSSRRKPPLPSSTYEKEVVSPVQLIQMSLWNDLSSRSPLSFSRPLSLMTQLSVSGASSGRTTFDLPSVAGGQPGPQASVTATQRCHCGVGTATDTAALLLGPGI